jgi:glutathione S-transferase
MKLIIATPSPYARKVRVVLREKNVEFEEIIDVPWNRDTLTKNLNPLGKIPILIEDGNEPLFDSKVIVQYLDNRFPNPLFYPESPTENVGAKLVEAVADGVSDALVLIFLENVRLEKLRSGDWIDRQATKIYQGMKYLSSYLGAKQFFVGDHFTIADISVFSCLEYLDLRFPRFNWKIVHPNLKNYWDFHKTRQSYLETKPEVQTIETMES